MTCQVTERLCYRCLYDTVRVMVDYKDAKDTNKDAKDTNRDNKAADTVTCKDKRDILVSKENYYSVKRDLLQCQAADTVTCRDNKAADMCAAGHPHIHPHIHPYNDAHKCALEVPQADAQGAKAADQGEDAAEALRGEGVGAGGQTLEWQRGVGGPGKKAQGLKDRTCDTGGWDLVYKGEVEVAMPAAVACKLRVEGRRARIHRTGAKELYDKLGVDGTVRRSCLKLAGCSKVYSTRTEMLRELNTCGVPSADKLRQDRLNKFRQRKRQALQPPAVGADGEVKPLASVMERLQEWEAKRKFKLHQRLQRQRELEDAELQAARALPSFAKAKGGKASDAIETAHAAPARKSTLTNYETQSLLQRMDADAQKRAEKLREFDTRIWEGMSKLLSHTGDHLNGAPSLARLQKRRSRPNSAARARYA